MKASSTEALVAQGTALVALVASTQSKVRVCLQDEVYVPEPQALLAKAGSEGAKKVVDALTEMERHVIVSRGSCVFWQTVLVPAGLRPVINWLDQRRALRLPCRA